ncbi:MAG: aminotransferase class V-fold PLP-dependent enzyme [Erysipelothrix sp.]|nr:aminotransferase class V-fold PLP-dependent enzyme [Erysipelothrix sp.]
MKAYPLQSITLEQATKLQFKLVDAITRNLSGNEVLTQGDLGVNPLRNQPLMTGKIEKVLADFFGVEDACLVLGSGTGAIRDGLHSMIEGSRQILIHDAPVYSTTQSTFDQLNMSTVVCDFNDPQAIKEALIENDNLDLCLIQTTRQQLGDSYDLASVIQLLRSIKPEISILTDDNYAAMKIEKIGAQCGADLSCFSMFKLLGPEGVGCVIGKSKFISKIRKAHYSGGSQVQGHVALAALRGLIYAPVALAISAQQVELIANELNSGRVTGIEEAVIVNAQSKVVLVKLNKPIAKHVLTASHALGAAPYPVGAESKYEFVPMFYRVSGTMATSDPEFENYWIRINPMRSGAETVLRILEEALKEAEECL